MAAMIVIIMMMKSVNNGNVSKGNDHKIDDIMAMIVSAMMLHALVAALSEGS